MTDNNNEQRLLILEISNKDSQKRLEVLEGMVLEVREDMTKTLQEQNESIRELKGVFQHIYNAIRYTAIGGAAVLVLTSDKVAPVAEFLFKAFLGK